MEDDIRKALSKAADYLVKKQEANGSWRLKKEKQLEPGELQKDIVLTAQSLLALLKIAKPGTMAAINRGVNFCTEFKLDSKDPITWWSRKLVAILCSNTELNEKQKSSIIAFLKKLQKEGRWRSYMSTYNLTNQIVIEGLSYYSEPMMLSKTISWFREHKAKDNKGWGKDETAEKSEYTFTSNMIIALIDCGESPTEDYLMSAREFLKNGQRKNGSWSSTKITVEKPTVYATSVAALALMLTSDDPLNDNIRKALTFILKNQSRNGGWPLLPKEQPKLYVTYYAVEALSFYLYLLERWGDPEVRFLEKKLKPQELAVYLFKKLKEEIKNSYREMVYSQVSTSNILGTTKKAIERRKDILDVLSSEGSKEIAEVIDSLRKQEKYTHLNKKAHMTQIKYDLQYLHGLNLVGKVRDRYFMVFNLAS